MRAYDVSCRNSYFEHILCGRSAHRPSKPKSTYIHVGIPTLAFFVLLPMTSSKLLKRALLLIKLTYLFYI